MRRKSAGTVYEKACRQRAASRLVPPLEERIGRDLRRQKKRNKGYGIFMKRQKPMNSVIDCL